MSVLLPSRATRAVTPAGPAEFALLLAQPGLDGFQVGVGEALLFSTGDPVAEEFLADGGGSLTARARAGSPCTSTT